MDLVKEHINNFERGSDPKKAMGIGQAKLKERLIEFFGDPNTFPSNEESRLKYSYLLQVIRDPITVVTFDDDMKRIFIRMPKSKLNAFFFSEVLNNLSKSKKEIEFHSFIWDDPENNEMDIWWA